MVAKEIRISKFARVRHARSSAAPHLQMYWDTPIWSGFPEWDDDVSLTRSVRGLHFSTPWPVDHVWALKIEFVRNRTMPSPQPLSLGRYLGYYRIISFKLDLTAL
jgi:hypothetical protein